MLKQIAKAKLGNHVPPPAPDNGPLSDGEATAYSPVGWEKFFDSCRMVTPSSLPACQFAVYEGGPNNTGPTFFLIHGAGQTSLSWALVAAELRTAGCRVLAMDLRGHGSTRTDDDSRLDMATLSADAAAVYNACLELAPSVVLGGHSVGGAVAARACGRTRAVGLVLVDVAEAAAQASFEHMAALLRARPAWFASPAHAVKWAVAAQLPRSVPSARVSVPPQLQADVDGSGWRWRTDVLAARPYWAGWYAGVTDEFLRVRAAKLLLLAGTDRLDKTLTIAQMQGRFQLALLPVPTGHSVQEDAPELTARTMREFAARLASLPPPRPLPV